MATVEPPAPPAHHGVLRRVVTALATIALGQVFTSGIQLLSVPVLLVAWGDQRYGEWLILFAVPAYLLLSDLGLSNVAGTEMTMLVARNDRERARDLFSSVISSLGLMSAAVLVLAATTIAVLPISDLFDFEELTRGETAAVLSFLVVQVVVTLQSSALDAGFRASGRFPTGALCRQLVRIAEVSIVPLVAVLGGNPVASAAGLATVALVGSIANWVVLLRLVPWLRPDALHRPNWTLIRPLVRPSLAYAALPLATAVGLQGMVLVVGAVLSPVAVVTFQTARTLSRLPQGVMYAINQSVWPEISSAVGRGHMALARSIHRRALQASVGLALLALLILLPLGPPIIRIWTHGDVDPSYLLFGGLVGSVCMNSLWYTSSVVLAATNRHGTMALLQLAGSGLALVVAGTLLEAFGLNAAGFALLAIDLIMVGYVLRKSLAITDDNPRALLHAIVRPPRRSNAPGDAASQA